MFSLVRIDVDLSKNHNNILYIWCCSTLCVRVQSCHWTEQKNGRQSEERGSRRKMNIKTPNKVSKISMPSHSYRRTVATKCTCIVYLIVDYNASWLEHNSSVEEGAGWKCIFRYFQKKKMRREKNGRDYIRSQRNVFFSSLKSSVNDYCVVANRWHRHSIAGTT